jgi:hypothetical protein
VLPVLLQGSSAASVANYWHCMCCLSIPQKRGLDEGGETAACIARLIAHDRSTTPGNKGGYSSAVFPEEELLVASDNAVSASNPQAPSSLRPMSRAVGTQTQPPPLVTVAHSSEVAVVKPSTASESQNQTSPPGSPRDTRPNTVPVFLPIAHSGAMAARASRFEELGSFSHSHVSLGEAQASQAFVVEGVPPAPTASATAVSGARTGSAAAMLRDGLVNWAFLIWFDAPNISRYSLQIDNSSLLKHCRLPAPAKS